MTRRILSASIDTLPVARRLLHDVVHRWQAGESPNARQVIEQHPEFANVKSVVIDLAYEEYCLRVEKGEAVDRDKFCGQFPEFSTSLCRRLEVHDFFQSEQEFPVEGQVKFGLKLLHELGRGALGRVFLAEETALGNRLVAVKFAYQGQYEAEFLGRLRHRNIVPVYSVQYDESSGLSAVVMPYLGDETLADYHDAKRGNVEEILSIAAQLAEALDYTHSRQILHRDLKPTNVLLGLDGTPMLMDFNLSTDVTVENKRLGGTLQYMAPEQLAQFSEGKAAGIDGRADLYSLGVILWELTTGLHPFAGQDQQSFDPRVKQEALPYGLRDVLARSLAFRPEDRYESAADLATALRRQLRFSPRARRWVRNHPAKAATGALTLSLALLTGGIAYANMPTRLERERAAAQIALAQGDYAEAAERLAYVVENDDAALEEKFQLGRAQIQIGEFDQAIRTFVSHFNRTLDGRSAACLAYIYCNDTRFAQPWHRQARAHSFTSPEMECNEGLVYRNSSAHDLAREKFLEALKQKPTLQAALYNLAVNDYQEAFREKRGNIPRIIEQLEVATSKCNKSARLYLVNAAARWRFTPTSKVKPEVLKLVRKALECGAPHSDVQNLLPTLVGDDEFEQLLATTPEAKPEILPNVVCDPLGEWPDRPIEYFELK